MVPHIGALLPARSTGGFSSSWLEVYSCMHGYTGIILAPNELPIGILTALCGGPYFVWLLRKTKEGDNMQLRLETKQLNYSIDGFDILKGISINVEDKKMVGL